MPPPPPHPVITLPVITLPVITLPVITLPVITLPVFTLPVITLPVITLPVITLYSCMETLVPRRTSWAKKPQKLHLEMIKL